MMTFRRCQGVLIAAMLTIACAESTPVSPVSQATPTPLPTAAAAPAPSPAAVPTPGPCDGCEPPTINTAPPIRLTLRLYAVEDGQGSFVKNLDPGKAIPVGWYARLDVVAKDASGDETNGSEDIEWHFSECCLAKVSGNHTHQRRLKVLKSGFLDAWVTQHGVRSNTVSLAFAN
jgi:hypothetical protein